jgi:putative endonuclease
MPTKKESGNTAETIAASYLQRHDYDIRDTNYTIQGGEIDIVAQRDGQIIFVEVRYRSDDTLHPLETLTKTKKFAMRRAANAYCHSHHIEIDSVRMDMISLVPKKDGTGYTLTHIRGIEI